MCVGVLATGRCLYAVARARSRSAHASAMHVVDGVVLRAVPRCACLLLPCRPQLARGLMQLFSVEQQKSQPLEAHAAAFSTVKVCICLSQQLLRVSGGSRGGLLMAQQGHRQPGGPAVCAAAESAG